jgi:hypothetical protein
MYSTCSFRYKEPKKYELGRVGGGRSESGFAGF